MKTLKCDMCDHEEQGESFEDWMNNLKSHYNTAHANFMAQMEEKTAEEQQASFKKWMTENKARFEAA